MKKTILSIVVLVVLIATISCTKQTSKEFIYTPQGVDVVKFGATFADLPSAVEGLYDKVEEVKGYDEMEDMEFVMYQFMLNDEKVIEAQVDNGKIYHINIYSDNISIPSGIKSGMTIDDSIGRASCR